MAAAFVSWPSAPLTESLVKRALLNLSVPIITSLPGTNECSKLLQWSTYDAIDHDLTHRNPDNVLSSSYTIRKALIRKHYLARCIHSYLTKHLDSVLKNAVPRTWDLEISYADELDEMWSDQLWDLGNEIDGSSQWWILKPGMADRGMGIRLFNSKDSLYQIFEEFEEYSEDEDETNDTSVIISQLRHFVIQEYIPSPLLLDPNEKSPSGSVLKPLENLRGHKFHLRAYFVASGALQLFMYDRVLALFAAVPYVSPTKREDDNDAAPGNIDLTPHLTNTSLQIDRGEEGVYLLDELSGCHILSGHDVDSEALFTSEDIENIKVQMGAVLAETFKAAVEMPIHFQPLPNAFELYGVDFLVSYDPTGLDSLDNSRMFQVKLLEINSEPAIELTGRRLHGILEDLFIAIEQVAVIPFFKQEVGCVPSTEVPVVPRYLRKCLDTKVRGSGGW
ncbi:tubulin-tyrosine ligase family-domain-containing protein [Suillus clintonianus]|uniref:tubulin-tyrosine ligase family-domain-containing protein n=1 Tax=Suillus clintonianus TaxID=1904413 RepID=UPI001B86DB0D|nr:tubulin-tyrosine ligase family-domain-containing protein [Suillus clintonianus]KAG2129923.1 tubulin-tyrosine ligase family-domain-containing protein [Suillus clintonianus]